jgi:hypothetical protein
MNGTSLDYAKYIPLNQQQTTQALKPPHNGGLYTGEPFMENAPWGNVPIVPITENLVHNTLKNVDNPTPGANTEYPHYTRLGNNFQTTPGLQVINNIACKPVKFTKK